MESEDDSDDQPNISGASVSTLHVSDDQSHEMLSDQFVNEVTNDYFASIDQLTLAEQWERLQARVIDGNSAFSDTDSDDERTDHATIASDDLDDPDYVDGSGDEHSDDRSDKDNESDATLFYTRKLAYYNLTTYDSRLSEATCFLWLEVDAHRGASEIGSCLYHKIAKLPTCQHLILYSDTCSGQNRNRYIISLFLYIVEHSPNILTIAQKFMKSGHSEMEVDSVHLSIENFRRDKKIYTGEDWHFVIRNAKKEGKPFAVVELKSNDFYDLRDLATQYNFNDATLKDINNDRVRITEVKQLKFEKNEGKTMLRYSYDYTEESLVQVDLAPLNVSRVITRAGVRGDKHTRKQLKKTYSGQVPISKAKKDDLVGLCKRGIIPDEAHSFYMNLPSSDIIEYRLAQPGDDEVYDEEY